MHRLFLPNGCLLVYTSRCFIWSQRERAAVVRGSRAWISATSERHALTVTMSRYKKATVGCHRGSLPVPVGRFAPVAAVDSTQEVPRMPASLMCW